MVNTFLDLRTQVADDIDRSDLTAQINTFINRSIQYYEKENFWFTETTVTFPTVASTESYIESGIATNIKDIIRVEITVSSNTYELTERDIDYIRNHNTTTTTTGRPTDYARYNGYLYLSIIPDAAYTVKLFYRKSYADLSANGDSNDYTNTARDLIESRTEWYLYKKTIKDKQLALDANEDEVMALDALRAIHNEKRATNTNKPTEF